MIFKFHRRGECRQPQIWMGTLVSRLRAILIPATGRGLPASFQFLSVVLAFLLAAGLSGCVTEAQANARARDAYFQGQKAAFASLGGYGQGVSVIGPVEHPNVPWVEGLTLAQAIATANYNGKRNPKSIIIMRRGEDIPVSPVYLLTGHPVPLQAGDTIKIQE